MSTILCIGDAHTCPEKSNAHWDCIGNLIADRRPDKVITMGDWSSLDSLSHWNANRKGNRTLEGKRYLAEIESANDALDRLLQPIISLQAYQRDIHKTLYRPELVFLTGNHDSWADQFADSNAALHGFIDYQAQLKLKERGFLVIPDKGRYFSDGICFMHAPVAANGKLISGMNALKAALAITNQSMVFAHTHRKESLAANRVGSDDLIQVMTVGCCFEGIAGEYVHGATTSEWRGVVMQHTWEGAPGRFDAEEISLERLKREYR